MNTTLLRWPGRLDRRWFRSWVLLGLSLLSALSLAAQTPTVHTNKPDYAPGEVVIIEGDGWQPAEQVRLDIDHSTVTHGNTVLYATADATGHIYNDQFVIQPIHLGEAFTLTATGQSSGMTAQTAFTDGEVTLTAATKSDGSAISFSADDAGGAYMALAGPVVRESSAGSIAVGTIVLSAPAGFEFDLSNAPVPALLITGNASTANNNINNLASGTAVQFTAPNSTATALTFSVASKSSGNTPNTLTWQNIRLRRVAGSSGTARTANLTNTGTAAFNFPPNGNTNYGTITVVAGALAQFSVVPASTSQAAGTPFNVALKALDQAGNTVSSFAGAVALSSTVGSISPTTSGSFTAGTRTESVTIVGSGVGKITASASGKTGSSADVTVACTAPAAPTLSLTQPTCATATGTATITGPTPLSSFTFSLDGGAFQSVTSFSGLAPGGHNIRTRSAAGCVSAAASFTINAQPPTPAAPTAGHNGPVCEGATLNLTASTVAGATYNWTGPNNFASTQQNPTITNVTAAAAGTYQVTVTANGCTSTTAGQTVVSITAPPTVANAGTNQLNLCGTSTTLAANTPASGTGRWTIESGTDGTLAAPDSPTSGFTGVAGATYTLRWTISNNPCAPSASDVQISFKPTVATVGVISGSSRVDYGATGISYSIAAVAGATAYSWHVPPGATYTAAPDGLSISVNWGSAATGLVTVDASNGCYTTAGQKAVTVNTAPTAQALSISTNEDQAVGLTLAATDAQNDALTYSIATAPAHGTLSGTGPARTYTPAADFNGADSFTYVATDGSLTSAPATVTISVVPGNDAPAATPQSVGTDEDTSLLITLQGSDVDADALTFSVVNGPSHGTLSGSGAALTYTPAPNYYGADSFTFAASDGQLTSAPATVSVVVAPVNDAPAALAQSLTTDEDTPKPLVLAGIDEEDSPLTYAVQTPPQHGTLAGVAPNLTYTPAANYNGPDTFTFLVSDGNLTSAPATVAITVAPVNDAPTANPQSVTTPEDTPVPVIVDGADVDGDDLTFAVATAPQHGTLTPVGGGWQYTPAPNYSGSDSFTFAASDGQLTSAPATVLLTVTAVNDAPEATAQSVTTDEDTPAGITLAGADVDGDQLTYAVSAPSHGTLSGTGASRTYTPAANYHGPDSFSFTVSDGRLTSVPATVTISVAPVNDAPVPTAQSVTTDEDTPVSITLAGNDVDGDPLSYSVVTGPVHGTLSGAGSARTYTPAANYNGPDSFSFAVSDGSLSAAATVAITVTAVNDVPVAAGQSVTTDEDVAAAITLVATDVESSPLTYAVQTPPQHGTLSGVAPNLTYTPAPNYNGSDSFTFTASDGQLTSALATVQLTVTAVNDAPVLAPIGNQAGDELALLSFTAHAADIDVPATPLTYALVGAPQGASIDPVTGVFSWTPTEAQGPDTYSFTVRVSDGSLSDEETITVTVREVNVAPVLAGVPTSATIDEVALYTFTATATDPDNTNQALTFGLVGAPAGTSIDPSTGAFTWTPTEAQGPGTYTFAVRVSDGSLSDTRSIALQVAEVNVAPVLAAIGSQSVNELGQLSFTAQATDADLPANTLTYSLSPTAPAGASIDPATGAFTWTPTEMQDGTHTFAVRVSDGALTDEESITVTVREVNVAPVLTAFAPQAVDEQQLLTFAAVATDADRVLGAPNALTYSLGSNAPAGVGIDAASGRLSWTPTEAQGPASYTFDVTVSDGSLSDIKAVTVQVREVNLAPVLAAIAPQAADELTPLTFTAAATDADLPANALTYSLVGAPQGADIDPGTGVFSWTPTETQDGSYTFGVRVSDGSLTDTKSVSVTAREVNTAPVLAAVGSQAADELTLLTFTASATDNDRVAGAGNTLTYSLSGAPQGASIGPATGVFTWTPTEAQGPNTYTFAVRVSDGALTDEETITVTVREVNVAPVLAAIGSQAVNEQTQLRFTAQATDADLPANTLTYSLSPDAPQGATIDPVTGDFTWTPTEAQGPDSYTFMVRVSDGQGGSASQEVTVAVDEVNLPPRLAAIGSKAGDELTLLTFTASAADADLPANTLSYSLSAVGGVVPAGANIDAATGVFSWTPTENQDGTYSLWVRVSDGKGGSASELITVTVREVNAAPVLASISTQAVDEQTQLTFTASATDADRVLGQPNILTYSLGSTAPQGASIDPATGAFAWTPTEAQGPNTYTFDVTVSDGSLASTRAVTVTVREVNVAPVLAAIGSQAVNEQTQLRFTAQATDADLPANTLTYSLSPDAPQGATIDPVTGDFTWTPTEAQGPNMYNFAVLVNDGQGGIYSTPVAVTVREVNTPPVLTAIGSQTVNELTQLSFTAQASDVDIPNNTLAFSLAPATSGGTLPAGVSITSAGVFNWTPTESQDGTYTLKVVVNDGQGGSAEQLVSIWVKEVNTVPVLTAVGSKAVDEQTQLTFAAQATDADLIGGVPNALTFSLAPATAGGTVPVGAAITSAGVFTWTPTEAQGPNVYALKVVVSDGQGSSAEELITVTVREVNVAPALTSVPASVQTVWGNAVTFTAQATDADLPANTLTYSLVGAPQGAGIHPGTGAFSWTPTAAQVGAFTFKVRVTDNGTPTLYTDSAPLTITVNKRRTALAYTGGVAQQYSDQQVFAAQLTDALTNAPIDGKTVAFALVNQASLNGAPTVLGTTGSPNPTGQARATLVLTQDPAAVFKVSSAFAGDAYYEPSADLDDFDVTVEDADVLYAGLEYFGTANSTSSLAQVEYLATFTDRADNARGNISRARASFRAGSATGTELFGTSFAVTPNVLPDVTVGTGRTGVQPVTLSTSEYNDGGKTFELYPVAQGYYAGQVAAPTLITIAVPGQDYVNGGGNVVLTQSGGTYAATAGSKMNFGFTMKWNRSGRNIQGQANIIFRRLVSGVWRTYQIKSNAINTLGTANVTGGRRADFNTKANWTDVTDPLNPISMGGSLDLTVSAFESTTGGAHTVAVTLRSTTALLFSSNWVGASTVPLALNGGKISVMSTTTAGRAADPTATTTTASKPSAILAANTELLSLYPNPAVADATAHFRAPAGGKAQLYLYNEVGGLVATLYNAEVQAGRDYYVPVRNLPNGVYLCRLILNGKVENRRLSVSH